MITRNGAYLQPDGLPTPEMLSSVIAEHQRNLPRLEKLRRYYMADGDILRRERLSGQPNNRMAHPFARYITSVATGYLVGKPVSYSAEDQSDAMEQIEDAFRRASIASIDAENARNASIYGRGVEYVYVRDADMLPRVSVLDPRSAFVVYDESYEFIPLFGVYLSRRTNADGRENGWRVTVMSRSRIAEYTTTALPGNVFAEERMIEHYFGDVPLVEYWNDENERGDFEWVIPLIDGYDKLQSDRVNDKERFVDALLVLIGCTMDVDESKRTPGQQLREDKMLSLPDSQSDVKYLTAQMDEAGAEVLREALVDDIHKLSMVPNLSDKDFAANASGVAMRYKLWGLEQLVNVKQQWFTEGLRQRLKLFAHYLSVKGAPSMDVADIKIKFTRALPVNKLEIAQYVQAADTAGAMSTETKVAALHEGDEWSEKDALAESEKILEERGLTGPDPLDPMLGDTERSIRAGDDGR